MPIACETSRTVSRWSERDLSPPRKSATPQAALEARPEAYCEQLAHAFHLTLQPTGSVSAGSGSRPSSTASSAPRSQPAFCEGSW